MRIDISTLRVALGLVILLLGAGCRNEGAGRVSDKQSPVVALIPTPPPPTTSSAAPAAPAQLPTPRDPGLKAAMAPYKLGKAVVIDNVAFVPIQVPGADYSGPEHLTLAEAMEKKLIVVKELNSGGSVPQLEMKSKAEVPIFIPFGSIVTGGKQDRMIRVHLVLRPKEKKKVDVYCVEQGRWSGGSGSKAVFTANASMASGRVRSAAISKKSQGEVWQRVSKANAALGNASGSSNFQGNLETKAFKTVARRLAPASRDISAGRRNSGVVVLVNGKVVAGEIFATPAYFRKVWPLLFKGYVVDAAASGKRKQPLVSAQRAEQLARDHLAQLAAARVTTSKESGLLKLNLQSKTTLGDAVIEAQQQRLIYLRLFPKEK
jgi:ARG and Rhodanese-Phosphatase-superfamily-associated Protein domain